MRMESNGDLSCETQAEAVFLNRYIYIAVRLKPFCSSCLAILIILIAAYLQTCM